LVDEPTAALDAEAEAEVMRALEGLAEQRKAEDSASKHSPVEAFRSSRKPGQAQKRRFCRDMFLI